MIYISSIKNSLKNIKSLSPSTNRPMPRKGDRLPQYFRQNTLEFMKERAYLYSTYFRVEVENLFGNQKEGEFSPFNIRVGEATKGSLRTNRIDDYKLIWFDDPAVEKVQLGTKFWFANCMWIAINPDTITNTTATSIIQKCTSVYNRLDYFGNVLTEPFTKEDSNVSETTHMNTDTGLLERGAFRCLMQYNSFSQEFKTDERMIIGSKAYKIRGINNSDREYTFDKDSIRLIKFTLFLADIDYGSDDVENEIANSKDFTWVINLPFQNLTLDVGDIDTLMATSIRNGQEPSQPYSYIWESSDTDILTIDEFGNYEAVGVGIAFITCTLKENPNVIVIMDVEVGLAIVPVLELAFDPTPPQFIRMFQSDTIYCYIFSNGQKTSDIVTFEFSGATEETYNLDNVTNNSFRITGISTSVQPLKVVATAIVAGDVFTEEIKMQLAGVR